MTTSVNFEEHVLGKVLKKLLRKLQEIFMKILGKYCEKENYKNFV